jgi:hypothetical protein
LSELLREVGCRPFELEGVRKEGAEYEPDDKPKAFVTPASPEFVAAAVIALGYLGKEEAK